jgi:hypothetical protein
MASESRLVTTDQRDGHVVAIGTEWTRSMFGIRTENPPKRVTGTQMSVRS